MSLKFSLFLGFLFLMFYFCQAETATKENRKCVPGKEYYNGCNNCMCANNMQNKKGKWEPVIMCTLNGCISAEAEDEKTVEPPEDFWQDV